MSVALSAPPLPQTAAPRIDPALPAAATRPAPAARAETARAPQPVETAAQGLDIRFEDRQGRPAGPPPAFQVSLLQAMQETALLPRTSLPAPTVAAPAQVDRKV